MDGIIGGCFPWSWLVDSVLWKHLCPKGLFFLKRRASDTTIILPKELLLEILSRLPLTSVIRFRLVCKQWCLLTSTPSFIEMHEKNQPTPLESSSAFVVQYFDRKITMPRFQFKTFFINEKATNRNKKFELVREYLDLTRARDPEQYYHIYLLSSYKGFLLFAADAPWPDKEESALIFYNPVTKEQVTVTAPPSRYVYWGVFFHSPTKEYRILYQVFDYYDHKDMTVRFELLGLQTRSLRKVFVNKSLSAKYHPDLKTPAVISNGALHWMVSEARHQKVFGAGVVLNCSETILSFGMESEEFRLMPHPRFHGGHDCVSLRRTGHYMNLMEMDGGILCLCDAYRSSEMIIFVMENYEKWTWVRRHVIPLHAFPNYMDRNFGMDVKALQIHQGELLLRYHPYKFAEQYMLYPLNQEEEEEEEPDDASYKFIRWLSFKSKNGSKNWEEQLECFDDDSIILKKKKKKKEEEKSRFKVVIDRLILKNEYLDEQTLRRMIINHPGTRPTSIDNHYVVSSASLGNIVVLTPSIASLQQHHHQSTTLGGGGGGGNYILSLQYENHSTTLTEYDVQTRKWRRILVADSSSSQYQ